MKSTNEKRNRNSRRKGSNRKPQKKDELRDFSDSRSKDKDLVDRSTNDPKWYANNPQLLKDAASYPFSQPVGRRWDTDALNTTKYRSVPGIMAVRLKPTYGWGEYYDATSGQLMGDVKSPINVAAAELYSFIRHANSGAKNYEAGDLMIYIAAMSNVYSYITWAMRIYGMARMYDQYNRYMPQELIKMNGVDWNSIQNNLANYRYYLNVLINKVSSLYVPATLPIFQRLAFLYQNVYSEGPSTKDQLYMYVPQCFHRFTIGSAGQGCLVEEPTSQLNLNNLKTWTDVINIGEKLFQAIWDEEDFATMSGDILKAFGGQVLVLNAMNEDYGLVPVFDEMVLTQIKNATVLSVGCKTGLNQISTPNYTGVLIPQAYYVRTFSSTAEHESFYNKKFLDIAQSMKVMTIPAIDPTPEMVIEASRMMTGVDWADDLGATGTNQYMISLAPTSEIVVGLLVDYLDAGTNVFQIAELFGGNYQDSTNVTLANLQYFFVFFHLIKSFKYMPQIEVSFGAGSQNTTDISTCSTDYLFEVDNYTTVGSDEVKKLNESALLSLYAVNSIGRNA